jgi:hypothetical protein
MNNLLDKITRNFIFEKQSPSGTDYINSVITKINTSLQKSISSTTKSNLLTAVEDLKKIKSYVIRLEEEIKSIKEENQELVKKLEKVKKLKATKEE